MLEHALEYAALGLRVLPLHHILPDGTCSCGAHACTSPGKHPRTTSGVKAATTDPVMIERWWSADPEANIGIATGAESGCFVIDVDEKSGGYDSLAEACAKYGDINDTWYAETGGGGLHFYFKHPGGVVKNKVGALKGIDIRGDGGYVVAPPSNHKSGRSYKWATEPGINELLPLPAPWEQALRDLGVFGGPSAAPQPGEYHVEPVPEQIMQGTRDEIIFKTASSLRAKGLGFDEILASIRVTNLQRCKPPLTEEEVIAKVNQACKYPPGTSLQFEKAVEQPKPEKVSPEDIASQYELFEGVDINPADLPKTRFCWDQMLPVGICLLAGAPKMGKSFMALALAMAVARGEPYLGHETVQGNVLYMALEDNKSRLYSRMNQIDPRGCPPGLTFANRAPNIGPALTAMIDMWAEKRPQPRLVIIDVLGKVRSAPGRGENAYQYDTRDMAVLKDEAEKLEITILVVHHRRKETGTTNDMFDTISGSQGIQGAMDSSIILAGTRLESAQLTDCKLHVTGRDFGSGDYNLVFEDGCRWRVLGDQTSAPESDPVVCALIRWQKAVGVLDWKGTPNDLRYSLIQYGMPASITPSGMSTSLAKFTERLRTAYNINVIRGRTGSNRYWKITPANVTFEEIPISDEEVPPEFL